MRSIGNGPPAISNVPSSEADCEIECFTVRGLHDASQFEASATPCSEGKSNQLPELFGIITGREGGQSSARRGTDALLALDAA